MADKTRALGRAMLWLGILVAAQWGAVVAGLRLFPATSAAEGALIGNGLLVWAVTLLVGGAVGFAAYLGRRTLAPTGKSATLRLALLALLAWMLSSLVVLIRDVVVFQEPVHGALVTAFQGGVLASALPGLVTVISFMGFRARHR